MHSTVYPLRMDFASDFAGHFTAVLDAERAAGMMLRRKSKGLCQQFRIPEIFESMEEPPRHEIGLDLSISTIDVL